MYRTFDFFCEACSKRETRLIDMAEHETQVCRCGKTMIKTFSAPHVRTDKLSASYVDGQRGKTKAFQELKRQSQLEDVLQDEWASGEDKAEAKKELKTIVGEGNI